MPDARTVYAEIALRSLPRLLSLLDRNPLSPTYGCFHRDYWLYTTSDFPDAVRQFGVHALALAYAHPLPHNPYFRNPNIRDWTIAALEFWAHIQHSDGSFDEFYPYERGWVGPTAFTTYTASEAVRLLEPELPPKTRDRIRNAIRRAAASIAAGQTEEDRLANHHAMAYLAVSSAADVLSDDALRGMLPQLWQTFLSYHQSEEGWSREYDGADPGYLTATISFLAKVYDRHRSPELLSVLREGVEFASYFLFPNGTFAGTLGSRNTQHAYPHGFELLSTEIPLAASVAERLVRAYADGRLVPPHIMSDRYVHYRVPELLLAAIDAKKRPSVLAQLPYERPPFTRFFPAARAVIAVHGNLYTVINGAKGGVVKSGHRQAIERTVSDTGWVGELADGRLVSSQWIAPTTVRQTRDAAWQIEGRLQIIPQPRMFTLWTHVAFRIALGLLGWYPPAAHWLKGRIRKKLILTGQPLNCTYRRTIELQDDGVLLTDELLPAGPIYFRRLALGGDIPIRYVPQSRFFQADELSARSAWVRPEQLELVGQGETIRIHRTISLDTRSQTGDSDVV